MLLAIPSMPFIPCGDNGGNFASNKRPHVPIGQDRSGNLIPSFRSESYFNGESWFKSKVLLTFSL